MSTGTNGISSPRDAVIVNGWRTPFGKRNGVFAGWHPVEMLSFTLKSLIEEPAMMLV